MNGVEILLIVGAGIAISAVARRYHVEPGLVVVVLAAGASFIPGVPRLQLPSEWILAIVVPPLLYSATRGASFASFGANLRAITSLGVVLVVLTTGALGVISTWLLPTLGAATCLVLGAVLAPPDTITTVSHGEEIGLPARATAILTGESLVNDATALTLFSIAVAAVGGAHTTWAGGIREFLYNAFAGIGIGLLLAVAALVIRKRLGNATLETTLVLLLPFTAFLAAEEAGASGILAVVAASFSVTVNLSLDPKHQYPGAYRTRLQEAQVWPVIDFLLETFVFAYIGLQVKFVLRDLAGSESPGLTRTLVAAGVLLLAAVVLRLVGVYALFGRWRMRARMVERRAARDPRYRQAYERRQNRRGERPLDPPTRRESLLVGWTGMRGILTLAAAAAVPEDFAGRDAIYAIALVVTLGTLIIQGTTVGRVARWLKFDVSGERSAAEARRELGRQIVAAAAVEPAADVDASFEAQRLALGRAVTERRLPEDAARELIEDIDLRQAAHHVTPPPTADPNRKPAN